MEDGEPLGHGCGIPPDIAKVFFSSHANGYESDQAVIDALKSDPNVAVIDASAVKNGGGSFGPPAGVVVPGLTTTGTFDAPTHSARRQETASTIRQDHRCGRCQDLVAEGLLSARREWTGSSRRLAGPESHFIKLNPGVNAKAVADNVERR